MCSTGGGTRRVERLVADIERFVERVAEPMTPEYWAHGRATDLSNLVPRSYDRWHPPGETYTRAIQVLSFERNS